MVNSRIPRMGVVSSCGHITILTDYYYYYKKCAFRSFLCLSFCPVKYKCHPGRIYNFKLRTFVLKLEAKGELARWTECPKYFVTLRVFQKRIRKLSIYDWQWLFSSLFTSHDSMLSRLPISGNNDVAYDFVTHCTILTTLNISRGDTLAFSFYVSCCLWNLIIVIKMRKKS